MYFWNIKSLTEDLKHNRVSEKDAFLYYLWWNIVVSLSALVDFSPTVPPLSYNVFAIFLLIVSTIYLYRCNLWSAWKNFLQKLYSISWVLWFRCVLPFFAVFFLWAIFVWLVLGILSALKGLDLDVFFVNLEPYKATWIYLLLFIYTLFITWRIGIHIKKTLPASK